MILLLFALALATPGIVSTVGTNNPERIWIARSTPTPLLVWNRGPLSGVEKGDDRSVRIHGVHRIALVDPWHTQFRLALRASGSESLHGVRLLLRTTEHDFAKHHRRGITVELTRSGLRIEHQGKVLSETDTVRFGTNSPTRIAVEHDGAWTTVAIDCAVFGPFRTSLPATEYTLIEPLGDVDSYLLLDDISVEGVFD